MKPFILQHGMNIIPFYLWIDACNCTSGEQSKSQLANKNSDDTSEHRIVLSLEMVLCLSTGITKSNTGHIAYT